MSDNQQRGQGRPAAQEPEKKGTPNQAPSQPPSKPTPEERRKKKSGTPIDIGPGPGADVVTVPQRRLG